MRATVIPVKAGDQVVEGIADIDFFGSLDMHDAFK